MKGGKRQRFFLTVQTLISISNKNYCEKDPDLANKTSLTYFNRCAFPAPESLKKLFYCSLLNVQKN